MRFVLLFTVDAQGNATGVNTTVSTTTSGAHTIIGGSAALILSALALLV